jgi:hypothetical protein
LAVKRVASAIEIGISAANKRLEKKGTNAKGAAVFMKLRLFIFGFCV